MEFIFAPPCQSSSHYLLRYIVHCYFHSFSLVEVGELIFRAQSVCFEDIMRAFTFGVHDCEVYLSL